MDVDASAYKDDADALAAKARYEGTSIAAAVRKVVEGLRRKVKGATIRAEFEAWVPAAERGAISQIGILIMPVNQHVIESVRAATGKDIAGYYHSVSEERLWHAMQKHSHDSQDTYYKDQLDLTWSDFELLPDILDTGMVDVGKQGNAVSITYTKDYGNVCYKVIQRIGRKKRKYPSELMFLTEWIKKAARGEGLAPSEARDNVPSSSSTTIRAQSGENVKGKKQPNLSQINSTLRVER